jgi:organic radical activating enzyme
MSLFHKIPFDPLEIHITHNCNLACHGCNHYSNYNLKPWMIGEKEFVSWIEPWARKISPSTFNILGGEPTIHPQLCSLIEIACQYFKSGRQDDLAGKCSVCLNTNGFFLHRHKALEKIMLDNNVKLFLSLHHKSEEYTEKIKDNLEMIEQWKKDGMDVTVYDYSERKEWRMFYKAVDENTILPFDDRNPRRSWERCTAKKYTQLFDGKIFKCANLAYLRLMKEKYKMDEIWDRYLAYKPLDVDASTQEIIKFLKIEEESACSMCPSNPQVIDIPVPLRVMRKSVNR